MNIFDFFQQKRSVKVILNAPYGIHLRPAAKISSIAKIYNCKTYIVFNDIKVDAKSINNILALGLKNGDEITIVSKGKESNEAIDSMVNFLSTLANKEVQNENSAKNLTFQFKGEQIKGTVVCGGLGKGRPFFLNSPKSELVIDSKAFENAYKEALLQLDSMRGSDIFAAQKALLETLPSSSYDNFQKAIQDAINELQGSEHEAKIADYKDLLNRVRANIINHKEVEFPNSDFILFVNELLPSDIARLSNTNVKGVVVKNMPARSHAALLLRTYNIPTVIISKELKELDDVVILDSENGYLITKPTKEDIELVNQKIDKKKNIALKSYKERFNEAKTKSGRSIKVLANIGDLISAKEAIQSGCDGIGLLRSEFLFQEKKPSLDEQCKVYSEIFELFDEVTVRTLDIGGDKNLPYVSLEPEQNPFLGIRGIRLFKTHFELMSEQLLAILKAKRKKELKVMFPMVATVDEFIEAKETALKIANENNLSLEGVSFGIMVEVPSVIFLIEEFNKVVDFYSIGTNDLSQYLFAIDRTHSLLSIDSHSSVLYDALKLIVDKASKPVTICGELASDEEAINRLINIGINALSVPSQMVPRIKSRIRDV